MKKLIFNLLVMIFTFVFVNASYAQGPPSPPGIANGTPGSGDIISQNGGGAPIGGGLFILLSLGAAYGGKRLFKLNNEEEN